MSAPELQKSADEIKSLKKFAILVYILQAATIPLVITYFIAPLLIYWKRKQARGTWLESHLRWQANTFWFSLIGIIIGVATSTIQIGLVILSITSMWFVFRIGQGWTRLSRGQGMLAEMGVNKAV